MILYNDSVLKAWKANIEIQFALDPYACATYIVSYINNYICHNIYRDPLI